MRLAKAGKAALLPHMGSATIEGRVDMGEKVIIDIQTFLDNHKPPDRVLPSVLRGLVEPVARMERSEIRDNCIRELAPSGLRETQHFYCLAVARFRHSATKATNAASAGGGWRRLG